jgi:hypothetical protein
MTTTSLCSFLVPNEKLLGILVLSLAETRSYRFSNRSLNRISVFKQKSKEKAVRELYFEKKVNSFFGKNIKKKRGKIIVAICCGL